MLSGRSVAPLDLAARLVASWSAVSDPAASAVGEIKLSAVTNWLSVKSLAGFLVLLARASAGFALGSTVVGASTCLPVSRLVGSTCRLMSSGLVAASKVGPAMDASSLDVVLVFAVEALLVASEVASASVRFVGELALSPAASVFRLADALVGFAFGDVFVTRAVASLDVASDLLG